MWVFGWFLGCIATEHTRRYLLNFILFMRIPAGLYFSYAHRFDNTGTYIIIINYIIYIYRMQMTDPNLINRVNTYDSPYGTGYHLRRPWHISILSTQH